MVFGHSRFFTYFFFFNDTATTEIYTLSLHDALPIWMAFGYYGLAWSVYSHLVARGSEVQFDKNAMMDIKFATRTPPQESKIRAVLERAVQGGGPPR